MIYLTHWHSNSNTNPKATTDPLKTPKTVPKTIFGSWRSILMHVPTWVTRPSVLHVRGALYALLSCRLLCVRAIPSCHAHWCTSSHPLTPGMLLDCCISPRSSVLSWHLQSQTDQALNARPEAPPLVRTCKLEAYFKSFVAQMWHIYIRMFEIWVQTLSHSPSLSHTHIKRGRLQARTKQLFPLRAIAWLRTV